MTLIELEKKLKNINRLFNIHKHNSKWGHNEGLYFGNKRVCALPSGHIWYNRHKCYKNMHGVAHRTLLQLIELLLNRGLIRPVDRRSLIRP